MKTKIIILLMITLSSCASKKVNENDCIEIYDKLSYDIYNIYYGKRNNDTIVFIGKKEVTENCNNIKFINKEKLKNIQSVILSSNEKLVFTYKTKDANNWLSVRVTGGTSENYFNTYSQFPYYIKDCSSFISECNDDGNVSD